MIRDCELQALTVVVRGRKKEGGYICLLSDSYVQQAIHRCQLVGCTGEQIKRAIEEGYNAALRL